MLSDVQKGNIDALVAYADLNVLIKKIEKTKSIILVHALNEADNYESTFRLKGYQFEKRNGGRQWDYSGIPEWQQQKDKLKEIEDKAKSSALNHEKGILSSSEDGEVIEMAQCKFKSDSLVVKKLES